MSYYKDQLNNWLKTIDVKADRVLDVGGASNPVKGRTKSWEVEEYDIADNGLENKDYDTYLNLNSNVGVYAGNIYKRKQYDIIFCLEVMEYVYNPYLAIEWLKSYTKKGILYISFPFIYPIHDPYKNDYLRYTRFGIIKLLQSFEIEKMIGREAKEPDKLIDFYKSDGMHIKTDSTITGYLVKAIKV